MESAKRTLTMIMVSFAIAGVAAIVILTSMDLGEPPDPDLAEGAAVAAAVLGAIGLLVAMVWTARTGDRTPEPQRLLAGVVIRTGIAELGLLVGILGLFMTGSTTPPYIGLWLFLASLFVLYLGLRRATENVT